MEINGPKIFFTIPLFGGIAVTQTLLTSFLVTVILCVGAVLLGRNLKKRPGKRQVLTEKAVTVITGMVSEAMGEHNAHWTPFIATIFLSSLLGTFLGMTGILRSSTADISTTMTWAVAVSFICWYQAIKNNGFKAWLKGFTEPIAVMTPMNLISEIAQPVSLAFRHFGNIAGGSVITALIYWALGGASAALVKLVASSHIAVTLALLAAGLVLILVLSKRSRLPLGSDRKNLPRAPCRRLRRPLLRLSDPPGRRPDPGSGQGRQGPEDPRLAAGRTELRCSGPDLGRPARRTSADPWSSRRSVPLLRRLLRRDPGLRLQPAHHDLHLRQLPAARGGRQAGDLSP